MVYQRGFFRRKKMIQFKEIGSKAEEAFRKDEIFEFLTGRNGYELRVIDAPVNVPTDWPRIINNGIYALYSELHVEKVIVSYEEAIKKLISGNSEDLWSAVNILYFQCDHEMMKKAPFSINKEVFADLKMKIINSRKALEEQFPYGKGGWNMYEDILRLNSNYIRDWGYSFLD
jgi:hypothetical protein